MKWRKERGKGGTRMNKKRGGRGKSENGEKERGKGGIKGDGRGKKERKEKEEEKPNSIYSPITQIYYIDLSMVKSALRRR